MMTKTKKIAATTLCAAMALSCGIAGIAREAGGRNVSASAEGESTVVTNLEWNEGSGAPVATYDTETGYSHISNLVYGASMTYKYKVKLDGLKVECLIGSDLGTQKVFGFGFSATDNCNTETFPYKAENTFCASYWPALYSGQTRFVISNSHDYNVCIAYRDAALQSEGVGIDGSYVFSSPGEAGMTLEFSYIEESDVWSCLLTRTQGTGFGGEAAEIRIYFNKQYADSVLDEDGYCYITACGIGGEGDLKIEDDDIRAYRTSTVAAAETAATDYENAIKAVTDADTFNTSVQKRADLVTAISALRENDQTVYNARIAQLDTLYTTDATVQANVKATVQVPYTAAETAVGVLATESNITTDNINGAKQALIAANNAYESMKNMLTEENVTYFTGLSASYDYAIQLATAKSWILSYEAQAEALESSTAIADDIVAIKSYRASYEGSTAQTIITGALTPEDKTALEGRIAAADAAVATFEEANSEEVKEQYLGVLESTLEEDLTIKFNVDDAKSAYNDLISKVNITAEDGQLYTRLTAAYATLKTACENYVLAEIEAVKTALGQEYTGYNAFAAVRTRYKAISLTYLMEENATIDGAYEELTEKIEGHAYYYVSTTDISDVTQNGTGLYFEQTPRFPSRLNYNKKLDATKGTEVVIELTEAAYYNTGSSANNLCFNFLLAPDQYKSMADGISIIIWLYATESNVQIFNNNDNALASMAIATPMDGGTITLTVKYGEYYDFVQDSTYLAYQIGVNEAKFVLTEAQLTQYGYSIGTDLYFSMGSFADDTSNPNCMTLVSVDNVDFAYVAPVIDVSGVTLSATASEIKTGESVTFTATVSPANAEVNEIVWYVNGQAVAGANSATYTLTPEEAGEYTVTCKVNGVSSEAKTVTVTAESSKKKGGCGGVAFGGTLGGGIALILVAATAAVVVAKRKAD